MGSGLRPTIHTSPKTSEGGLEQCLARGTRAVWPICILTLIGISDVVSIRKGSGSFSRKKGKEGFFP